MEAGREVGWLCHSGHPLGLGGDEAVGLEETTREVEACELEGQPWLS